jgi:hypothetical protein
MCFIYLVKAQSQKLTCNSLACILLPEYKVKQNIQNNKNKYISYQHFKKITEPAILHPVQTQLPKTNTFQFNEFYLPANNAMKSVEIQPMFRRNIWPPS